MQQKVRIMGNLQRAWVTRCCVPTRSTNARRLYKEASNTIVPPASVAGHDILTDPMGAKTQLGYLCEMPPVYREMIVRSYLGFVADIKRVPRSRRQAATTTPSRTAGALGRC